MNLQKTFQFLSTRSLVKFAIFFMVASFSFSHHLIAKKHADQFIIITPPKCGTFILAKLTEQITGKKHLQYRDYFLEDIPEFFKALEKAERTNRCILTHIPPDETVIRGLKKKNYKIITVLRDPRDQLISAVHWIPTGKDVDHLFDVPVEEFEQLTLEEQIEEFITGERFGFREFEQLYARHYGWLDLDRRCLLVTRFEDLVGSEGGGTDRDQLETIRRLAQHVGVRLGMNEARQIASQLFGAGPTFRSGQIGEWKEIFTDRHKELFKEFYGEDLIRLGYETDLDW